MSNEFYVLNDHLAYLQNARKKSDGSPINGATVDVTVTDRNGTPVTGETWPVTMTYTPGSDGEYVGQLPASLDLTKGGKYIADVTFNAGAGLVARWKYPLLAKDRLQ